MIARSLMIQLSLAVVLITSIVLFGFGTVRYQKNLRRLPLQMEQQLELSAKRLSISLRAPVYNFAESETRDVILSEMEDPDIAAIIIETTEAPSQKYIYSRAEDKAPVQVEAFSPGRDEIQVSRRISYGVTELGRVTIFMTPKYLRQQLHANLYSDILQIVILDIILITLMIALLRFRFVLPIKQLAAVATEISRGRLDFSINTAGEDEIGFLAKSFALMRDAIRRQIVDLNTEIDERKEAEKKLRSSERQFRQLSNATWEAILVHHDGEILLANDHFYELFGYTKEEVAGRILMHHMLTEESAEKVQGYFMSGELGPYEVMGRTKDGRTFPMEVRVRMMEFQGKTVRVAAIRDLSERKRSEQRIADALEFLEKIVYESPIGISIYTMSGKCVNANDAAGKIIGTTRENVIAQNFNDIVSWKESGLLDVLHDAIAGNQIKRHEVKVTSSFGEKVYLDCHVVPFFSEEQMHILLMINDISERIKAEEELRHLRNYLKNIVDSMPSILVGVDSAGRITQWNLEAEKVTGIGSDDTIGRHLHDVFPQLSHAAEQVFQAVHKPEIQKNTKVPLQLAQRRLLADVTIYPLMTNGVGGAVIRVDDITERARIEEIMVQSEKMLSLGGLAAGMAHEINNPLSGILQNIQVLENRIAGDLPKNHVIAEESGITMAGIRQYAEKRGLLAMTSRVREAGGRAAKIIENMLSFSRKGGGRFDACSLPELIDRTIELASSDYDLKKKYDFRRIRIVREYDEKLPDVRCEPTKIQQVFLNVLKNAAQAMAAGDGTKTPCITIRVTVSDPGAVCVEIADNGMGMTEATRRRIFEPFFTTKDVGVGTGLGLSISYFIVTKDHQGEMSVASVEGEGTKFIICLPVDQKSPSLHPV